MARRKKTIEQRALQKRPVRPVGNNLDYGGSKGLGNMGMHLPREQSANAVNTTNLFLHDIAANPTPLSPALREEFAKILKDAYGSPDVNLNTPLDLTAFGQSFPTTPAEYNAMKASKPDWMQGFEGAYEDVFPQGLPTTVGGLQKVVMGTYYPEALQYARSLKTSRNGLGDLVGEAIASIPETIQNWEPGKGSFLNYMQYGIRDAMVSANRASKSSGIPLSVMDTMKNGKYDETEFELGGVATPSDIFENAYGTIQSYIRGDIPRSEMMDNALRQYYTEKMGFEPTGDNWMDEAAHEMLSSFYDNSGIPDMPEIESKSIPWYRDMAHRMVDTNPNNGTSLQSIQTSSLWVPKGEPLFVPNEVGLTINPDALTTAPMVQATLHTPKQVQEAISVLSRGNVSHDPVLADRITASLQNAYVVRNEGADINNLPTNWANKLMSQVQAEDVKYVNGRRIRKQFQGVPVEGVYLPVGEKGKAEPLFSDITIANPSGKEVTIRGVNPNAVGENLYEHPSFTGKELELYGNTLDVVSTYRKSAREAKAEGNLEDAQLYTDEANALVNPDQARVLAKEMRVVRSGWAGKETVGGNILGNMGSFENAISKGKYDEEPATYSPNQLGRTSSGDKTLLDKSLAGVEDPQAREEILDRAANIARSMADPSGKEYAIDDVGEAPDIITEEEVAALDAKHAEAVANARINESPMDRMERAIAENTGSPRTKNPIYVENSDPAQVAPHSRKALPDDVEKGSAAKPGFMNHERPEYNERGISFGNLTKETEYAPVTGSLKFAPIDERDTQAFQYRDQDGRLKWMNIPAEKTSHVDRLFSRGRVPSTQELREAQRLDREGVPVYGPAEFRRPDPRPFLSEERQITDTINSLTEWDPTAQMGVDMARAASASGRVPSGFIAQWKAAHPDLGLAQTAQFDAGRQEVYAYRGTLAGKLNKVTVNPKLDPSLREYVKGLFVKQWAKKNENRGDAPMMDWAPMMDENGNPLTDMPFAGNYSDIPEPDIPPMEGLLDAPPVEQSAPAVQQPEVSDAGMPPEPEVPAMEDTVPAGNAGQPPVPPTPPAATVAAEPQPERRPVQGAATQQTVARASAPTAARAPKTEKSFEELTRAAEQGARVLEMDYPDYISDHLGRGPENKDAFNAWRESLGDRRPAFEQAHRAVMEQKWVAAKELGPQGSNDPAEQTVYQRMIAKYGWKGNGSASNPAAQTPPTAAPQPPVSNDQTAATTVPSGSGASDPINITTQARRLAEQNGIDPAQIQGTGKNGRVVMDDVRQAIASRQTEPTPVAERSVSDVRNDDSFLSADAVQLVNDLGDSVPEKQLAWQAARQSGIPVTHNMTAEEIYGKIRERYDRRSSAPARTAPTQPAQTRFVGADQINEEMAAGYYDDEYSLPPDFFNERPVVAMDREQQQFSFNQARIQAQVAQLRQIDHEWTRELAQDLGINPDGSERKLTEEEQAAQNVARDIRAAQRLSGEAPTAEERAATWAGRVSTAQARVASLRPVNALKGKEGHSLYGDYNEVSNSFVKHGVETVSSQEINDVNTMIQGAFSASLSEDLSGLSPKEIGATIEKRVREKFENTLKAYEKHLVEQEGKAPEDAKFLKQKANDIAQGMIDAGMNEIADTFGAHGYKDIKYGVNARGEKALGKITDSNVDVAARVNEMGGDAVVGEGPLKVLQVGDKALTVGASKWSGAGGGSGRGGGGRGGVEGEEEDPKFKSIYQSNVGHFMMAQFMADMAWKQTGGQVLQEGMQWSLGQYGYLGIASMGGNRLGSEIMATARHEIAANRSGSIAYEQYGFMNEMGYALSGTAFGPGLERIGNDAKMTIGAAAAAGIGTWGVGSLIGGTAGAALTASALPVAGAAALAVGIPAVGMTMYNTLTGQDSYGGSSLKNVLAGAALNSAEQGRNFGGWTLSNGAGLFGLPRAIAMSDGSYQDDYTQKYYGQSARDYVMGSYAGKVLGAGTVNWLFEGRDEKSAAVRDLADRVMEDTGMKEDAVRKSLSSMQIAFGGFDTAEQRESARYIMNRAQKLGIDATDIMSNVGNVATQRGVLMGSDEFQRMTLGFASMTFEEQQKEVLKSSRDFQKYAQWVPYLEGGNAEGYALYQQLGGNATMAQTQAIQSAFAQAQQLGVNLTPGVASSMATTVNSLQPYQAMEATRMASSLAQMGAGAFSDTFSSITDAIKLPSFSYFSDVGNGVISTGQGNRTDTLQFLQGVMSGNQYAMSDYGRMAGIGVLQSVDQNGLQMGLKDMSGLLLYAQQNLSNTVLPEGLQSRRLSGADTLAAMGLTFNQTSSGDLLNGGIWGYQQQYVNQTNALQMQGLNMQFAQLADTRQYTYASWGLENQMNNLQWQDQLRGFQWQNTMLDTNNRFRLEDAALTRQQRDVSNDNNRWTQSFDYQTSLMRRDWAREDYQYNTQMRQLSFSWSMEDLDEQIRRSSGYERAQLIKQRNRANLSNNLESGQAETQFERQEQLWKREDERYQKSLEFNEKMIDLDNSRFELNQKQAGEMYQLQKEHLSEEQEAATKLHDVRMEMEQLQRERAEEQMKYQEQSLNLQKQQMLLQNEYTDNMTKLSRVQAEQEAQLRKITSYGPAFSRLLADFLTFLENASEIDVPTYGSSITR